MFECRGCGLAGPGRVGRVYCSNSCQRAHERRQRITRWLATGEAFPGTNPQHYVRQYLFEDQQGRCAICGLRDSWNGGDLRFVLDHVSGDAGDNRRDNLRLVCPNCDSQLDTYKSRNRGQGRHARRERYAQGLSY